MNCSNDEIIYIEIYQRNLTEHTTETLLKFHRQNFIECNGKRYARRVFSGWSPCDTLFIYVNDIVAMAT